MAKKKSVQTEVEALPSPGVLQVEEYPVEETYLSQSELTPNARWVSERLNDILYRLHREQFTTNEVNKLRAQLENSVFVK